MSDTDRLIAFMRDEQAAATDERESWFKATGDEIERLTKELGHADRLNESLRSNVKRLQARIDVLESVLMGWSSYITQELVQQEGWQQAEFLSSPMDLYWYYQANEALSAEQDDAPLDPNDLVCSHCGGDGTGKMTIGCEWCGGTGIECDPDVIAEQSDG